MQIMPKDAKSSAGMSMQLRADGDDQDSRAQVHINLSSSAVHISLSNNTHFKRWIILQLETKTVALFAMLLESIFRDEIISDHKIYVSVEWLSYWAVRIERASADSLARHFRFNLIYMTFCISLWCIV